MLIAIAYIFGMSQTDMQYEFPKLIFGTIDEHKSVF